ncbi:hypothetical protein [Cyclobacterium amurskyense]|nr:hypothetical protein [Cyclobacterium amurskyense]
MVITSIKTNNIFLVHIIENGLLNKEQWKKNWDNKKQLNIEDFEYEEGQ